MKKLALAIAGGIVSLVVAFAVLYVVLFRGSDASEVPPVQATQGCTPGAPAGGLREDQVPNGWGPAVTAAGQAAGIDPAILAAQLQTESSWRPDAVGRPTKYGTAKGMAQFIDSTWAEFGEGSVFDPLAAIAAQGKYMGWLMDFVADIATSTGQNQLELALAGYNAGPGAVQQANGMPQMKETIAYVPKIMNLAMNKYSTGCPASPAAGTGAGSGQWQSPLPNSTFTSCYCTRWGDFHYGIDLAGGDFRVLAPTAMRITWSGPNPGASGKGDGYGWSVVGRTIDGTDIQMRFGHCAPNSTLVQIGQTVDIGQQLCTEGRTGYATGVHLHFEVFQPGVPENSYASNGAPSTDPRQFLLDRGVTV